MFPKMFVVVVMLLSLFASPANAAQSIDINKADVVTIAEGLNGIGESKARAIVEYRAKHGAFVDEQDLIKVKGIGAKLIERNRSVISFGKSIGGSAADEASSATPVPDKPATQKPKPSAAKSSDLTPAPALGGLSTETGAQPQLGN